MTLYILRPVEGKDTGSGPWNPWYDTAQGFVVAATSMWEARKLAADQCGGEGKGSWMDSRLSTCGVLKADKQGVILRDFASA